MWFLITSIIVSVFLTVYLKIRGNTFWKHVMAIPGPKAYPVVGNISEMLCDPETLFINDRRRSKMHYPIYKLWSLNRAIIALIHPYDIELVLTNVKHNTKAELYDFLHSWLGTGLLTSNGSKWQSRRKILTPAFHFNILQEFVDIFNRETENLIKGLEEKCGQPYIDVVKPITEFTLYSIGETSLGVNLSEEQNCATYKQKIYDYGHLFTYRLMRPWLHYQPLYNLTSYAKTARETVKVLHEFSRGIIQERKKLFQADGKISYSSKKQLAMLDLLLSAKYAGADLDDEGIREEVDTFVFEGHDTTSMAICYALMALANERHIQDEIVKEIYEILGDANRKPDFSDLTAMKYTERCIKECLRLYPSVPFIARIAGEEFKTFTGYTIPKGANIGIYIYDLHRLPQFWENPEKFDPDRFLPENVAKRYPFAYLPFSAGPRNCIGQKFAILEIKAVLCGILRKFKLEPVDTPQTLKFKADLVLRPADHIKVKFVPIK